MGQSVFIFATMWCLGGSFEAAHNLLSGSANRSAEHDSSLDVVMVTRSVSSLMAWQVRDSFSSKHVCQGEGIHRTFRCSSQRKVSVHFCSSYNPVDICIGHCGIRAIALIQLAVGPAGNSSNFHLCDSEAPFQIQSNGRQRHCSWCSDHRWPNNITII